MSKLIQHRESLIVPPEVAITDTSWAYLHSYSVRPTNIGDLDSRNYKFGQTQQQNAAGSMGATTQHITGKGHRKEPIDRFASIIDAEDPKFEKQRKENSKNWEQNVQNLCLQMSRGIDAFYDRKSDVYEAIVDSTLTSREEYTPQVDITEMTEEIKDMALAPWIFQTLPGTKPAQQWPQSLEALSERIEGLAPLSLWNEPLDLICGGPEFFEEAFQYINRETERLLKEPKPSQDETSEILNNISIAISNVLGISVLMGSHEKILQVLDTIIQINGKDKALAQSLFEKSEGKFKSYLQQIHTFVYSQKQFHYMTSSSIFGVISIAKFISFVNQNEHNSSITTDGEYIYLYIGLTQRGGMYKIGTGEKGTIAGKVYLHVPTDREGDVTWVFCKGKLYSRRANEELGSIMIIDPETFKQEGMAKLFCGEAFSTPVSQSLNRYYPLLSDGNNLFIITMGIQKKKRRIKDSMKKEYLVWAEQKKKKFEEQRLQDQKKAKIVKKDIDKFRKDDNKMIAEMMKLKESLKQEDKATYEKLKKEIHKQKLKIQKQEAQRQAEEQRLREKAALGAEGEVSEEQKEKLRESQDPEVYKICEFYLHEFDIENESVEEMHIQELLKQDDVREMFYGFSGFFTFQECYRALKFNNYDIAQAAQWLVDEGEKERGKKSLIKKRSVLLGESEVISENQTKRHETDIVVKPESVLYPTNITTGKWSIAGNYVTYHNLLQDNGQISIFSTREEDIRILNQKDQQKESTEDELQEELQLRTQASESKSSEKDQTSAQEQVFVNEDDLFNPIKLQGTLVKTIKNPRCLESGYNTYITYDHVYKKFYLMLIGQSYRYIAVANDFNEMSAQLSIGARQKEIQQLVLEGVNSMDKYISCFLSTLDQIGKLRFQMPWRWNSWSNVYLQVLQQWGIDFVEQSENIQNNRENTENRKKVINKLTTRLEKVGIKEKQQDRERLNLAEIEEDKSSQLDKEKKKSKKKKEKQPEKPSTDQKLVLPRERIILQKETKKVYAFQTTGSENCLSLLFKNLEGLPSDSEMFEQMIRLLLGWTLFADVQIMIDNQETVDKVSDFLIGQLIKMKGSESQFHQRQLIWIILITGWNFYLRTTLKQIKVFNLMLDDQKLKVNSLADENLCESMSFYQKLLDTKQTPIQLFYTRFYHYSASFYPIEVLYQSKMVNLLLLIDKTENSMLNDEGREIKDKDQIKKEWDQLQRIRPLYYKFRRASENFQNYKVWSTSLSEVKDFYEKDTDVGTLVNHTYFSMPFYTTFINQHEIIEDLSNLTEMPPLDHLLKMYDQDVEKKFAEGKTGHEQKLQLLKKLRNEHQEQSSLLIDKFKQYIRETLQDESQWNKERGQYVFKVFHELLMMSLGCIDFNQIKHSTLVVNSFKFVEELMTIIQKSSNGYKSQFKDYQKEQLVMVQNLLHMVINITFPLINFPITTYIGYQVLPTLLRILEQIKQLFVIQDTSTENDGQTSKSIQLLEQVFITQSEGTDFIQEKVFETSHPYPRIDIPQKEVILSEHAIAFSIELDKRCQTEHSSDILTLYSQDHAFNISDLFGTHHRFYGKPQTKYPFFILGNKLTVEFRSQSQQKKRQGRGGNNTGYAEELAARWGFRLHIRPIYGEASFKLFSKKNEAVYQNIFQRILNEEKLKQWESLLNQLVFVTSLLTRVMIKANFITYDCDESMTKIINWHLFKGGVKNSDLEDSPDKLIEMGFKQKYSKNEDDLTAKILKLEAFKEEKKEEEVKDKIEAVITQETKNSYRNETDNFVPLTEQWPNEVKELLGDQDLLEKINKLIRAEVQYSMPYLNERRKPSFLPEYQVAWVKVEQHLICSMLYHSNSIDEMKKLIQSGASGEYFKLQNWEQSKEKLKLIGQQINDVLSYMQSRLQGQQEFQRMLRDIVEESQQYIDKVKIKKQQEEEERKKKEQEDEQKRLEEQKKKEEEMQKQKEEEEKKRKELEEEKKIPAEEEKAPPKKKVPQVSIEPKVKKAKRNKIIKMAQEPIKKKDKKKKKGGSVKPQPKGNLQQKEEKKEEEVIQIKPIEKKVQEEEKKEEEKPVIHYLKVSKQEEQEIKNKIYNKVYENFLQQFQGNQDRVKPLCMLLNIKFNAEDPNESLKAIFKRVKNKLKLLIDFDGEISLREHLDIEELKLESPYKEVSKEVLCRLQFLFEFKTSIDYQNIVSQNSQHSLQRRSSQIFSSFQKMNLPSQYDDQGSTHRFDENASQEDSEILEPLGAQRSQSLQVGLQPSLHGIQGVSQAVMQQQQTMKDDEIVNWIDSYRKWRQWNRYHNQIQKNQGLDFEEDLTSAFCSPLFSVVAFAKQSRILNPEQLRKIFNLHKIKSALRVYGLHIQQQLQKIVQNTPLQRFVWGNLSSTLVESTFNGVETCGEQMAKLLNEHSRLLVKQLMENINYVRRTINSKSQSSRSSSSNRTDSQQQQPSTSSKERSSKSKGRSNTELFIFEQLKNLIHSLNDVRVLLNNVYTREYVLESLKLANSKNFQIKDDNSNFLGTDTIKQFLKSVVSSFLLSQDSESRPKMLQHQSPRINFAIIHCSKLILNQFMSDKSMLRSSETQRILQEMLLDIIVEFLERICIIKLPKTDQVSTAELEKKQHASRLHLINSYQLEIVQLLKLLSEVIRISNDDQQLALQTQRQQSPSKDIKQTFFLNEGSEKVMKCAQILAYLMHNIEIPVVMRQTIKCAKLFFKLVDFNQLKLYSQIQEQGEQIEIFKNMGNPFLIETLKQIGQKISNTNQKNTIKQEEKQVEKHEEEEKDLEKEEKQYVVYANINSSEEDFSFILTALYHWENLYPSFTLLLPKDPNEIVVIQPKKKDQENQKEEEEKKSDLKQDESQPMDQLSHAESQVQKLMANMAANMAEIDSNSDLQELINIQRQQIQGNLKNQPKILGRAFEIPSRGGRGGHGRGGYYGYTGGPPRDAPKQQLPSTGMNTGNLFGSSSKVQYYAPQFMSSHSQYLHVVQGINNIGIHKLEQLYEEIIKATWEDGKEEDSEEEKMRKLNEKNYNTRVLNHLREAIHIAALLFTRYSGPICEPMSQRKALEFSNLLQRAYNGQLEGIGSNPFTKKENKDKKIQGGKVISSFFPLCMKSIEGPRKSKDLAPGMGLPITIAPKQLVVSIAEKKISSKYEQVVDTKVQQLKNLEKNPIDGFNANIIGHNHRRQGASISVIIQEFIQLIRSLVLTERTTVPESPRELVRHQKSMIKIQMQQEMLLMDLIELFNLSLDKLAQMTWSAFTKSDLQIIYGVLGVIGGWNPPLKTGQPVQVEINNQWCNAVIVDDGHGKKNLSVILEDDLNLQIIKVPTSKARPYEKYNWQGQNTLDQIDQIKLQEAIIRLYKDIHSDKKLEDGDECEMLNQRVILLMLLKVSAQLNWIFVDNKNERFKEFMHILLKITQDQNSEEDKTKVYWEKALIDSWERIIDKSEDKNYDFFVVRENFVSTTIITKEESKDDQPKEESKEQPSSQASPKKESTSTLQQDSIDTDYVQPLSSYLKGLPEPIPKKNQSEAALKLLAYWEKNIIPKIIEFVRTTYKNWEMEFYFEQLRYHLRNGDSQKALEDALTMCERKLPQGCNVPDETYDWTCKMIDECIVDSWALAKFKQARHVNFQGPSQSSPSSAQGNTQGETSFPLLNKLVNYGIEEIVILIKAVDLRSNVVLAEYQDSDTMQVHSIWIPVSNLNDLHSPLPPRSIGYKKSTLNNVFEFNVAKVDQIYARQTLIQLFSSCALKGLSQEMEVSAFDDMAHEQDRVVQMPIEEMKLQEVISWSVWDEFSNDNITGWMKELYCAVPLRKPDLGEESTEGSPPLQQLVEDNSELIVFETLLNQQVEFKKKLEKGQAEIPPQKSTRSMQSDFKLHQKSNQKQVPILKMIKQMMEKSLEKINDKDPETLKQPDVKNFEELIEWCVLNWFNLSERIRDDRVAFDLCKEYENYQIRKNKSSSQDSELSSNNLLPLHELIKNPFAQTTAIGSLLRFKKSGAHLTPTSKIQFFSDENKVNLVCEISAGTEGKRDLPPLLLNHGKIWVHFDAGTTALLPKHQQLEQKSSLPCALLQIPSTWTVCCWLTEALTNALLTNSDRGMNFIIANFQKLINALTIFYEEAKPPSLIKSIILTLLSRLIRKLRFLYSQQELRENSTLSLKGHFDRLFINQGFISSLLSELLVFKEVEEQNPNNQGQQTLYSAFVQDCVEFILTIMLPTSQKQRVESYKDLLDPKQLSMPNWIEPLIKVSYFLHYFTGETPLPVDILKEIYDGTQLDHKQLDYIFVIQNIPINDPKYTQIWIREQIIKICIEHGVRILNPEKEIVFSSPDTIVLVLDGYDHMKYEIEIKENQDSESDQEEVKKKDDDKPPEEELKPTEYTCPACTFINRLDAASCEICGSPRPPMEVILADLQAQLKSSAPDSKQEQIADQAKPQEKKEQHIERLELLAHDLSKIVSRDQRKVRKELLKQKEEEMKKQKEEEDKKKKEEEDKKKKEEEDKKKKEEDDKQKQDSNKKSSEKSEQSVIQELLKNHPPLPVLEEKMKEYISQSEGDDQGSDNDEYIQEENWGQNKSEESINDPILIARKNKLIELGIDPDVVDQDPDLAQALAESLLAEEAMQNSSKQEEEEEAKKKKEKEEELKKKQELEKKLKEEEEKGGQEVKKVEYIKLKITFGKKEISDDISCSRVVHKILTSRISKSEDLELSDKTIQILKDIHQTFRELPIHDLNCLPKNSLLEDLDISPLSIKENEFEDFFNKILVLIDTDIKLFYEFLESQGYDLWLEKVCYPSFVLYKNKNIDLKMLEKLKTFIEVDMCQESKGVNHLFPNNLRLISKTSKDLLSTTSLPLQYYDDSNISNSHPEINEKLDIADVRFYWSILKIFNKYLAPAVPYINNSQSISDIPSNSVSMTISAYMSFTRNLCLMNVKFDLRHLILEKTSIQRETIPKLYFERLKLAHKIKENEDNEELAQRRDNAQEGRVKDKKHQDFMFIQAYEQIKDMDLAQLRPKKPQGAEPHLSFHIVFKGEHVVGEGGPYRQFFADISQELQPSQAEDNAQQKLMNLLQPSANNRAQANYGKGKFVLCPSKNSSHDLSLFEFLGVMMGVCIRTGSHMNLDLPQFVWKQLVGQKITHEDIIEIDFHFYRLLSFMLSSNQKLFQQDQIFETWTVTLSDESIVELKTGGKEERVNYEDRVEYVRKALYYRMKECQLQCEAIKRGMIKIIPEALLNMVTYNELETWVCGKSIVDMDLLRRHTKYGGDKKSEILTEESQRIKWFWEVVKEFQEDDKAKFIKFCWGQQRLPANDEEFERRQVRFMIKPAMNNKSGDGALPKADTCFFNLELPNYSSKEVMKQRLLLAIHTDCDSLNAEADRMDMINDGPNMDGDHSYDEEY